MHRNLITRLGIAAGLVAALVATVFILIVRQVSQLEADGMSPATADRIETLGVLGLVVSTVSLLLLSSYLVRFVVVPLRSVTSAAEGMASGDLSVRVRESGDAEPVALARAFNELAANLQAEQAQTAAALTALAAEKGRVETFHRAGERLAAARDLPELVTIALAEIVLAAGADGGGLWAMEHEKHRELFLEVAMGVGSDALPATVRADDSPAGRALASERLVVVDGPQGEELHLPLVVGGRVHGLMSLVRVDGAPLAVDQRDTLMRLGEQVAVALSNAVSFRAALRSARVNRAVLDATPDPIGLLGLDGAVVASNAAMNTVWETYRAAVAREPGPADEQRDLLQLGDRSYLRYAGPVFDDSGERMGRLVVLRDVTSERESERVKDEFFALVSHELRTPLTSIIGYLELVRDDEDELTADTKRFLEVVDRNAKRLLRLVGDMLFVAQVDAGRLSLERGPVDLAQIVADAVEAARPAAARGGVSLRLEAGSVGPVDGDRDRLGQLVDNLVSNALKFTPEGGEVVVRLADGGAGSALVDVRDNGMGIPDAEQQHLFERFFRSASAASRAVPGAGLGLTIVKTIVEAHDGRVTLQSTENVGTTVRVTLPLDPAEPA